MAKWIYDEALKRLLAHEGGYTNHPSDPGGPTNWGITIFDYRKYINARGTADDVRRMTLAQAKAIYKSKYWNAMRCDDLPAGVDYAIFDYGVNSGTGRAPKVLQRVLGVTVDGQIGEATLAALKVRDPKHVVNAVCDERLRFLQALRTWPVFGAGWGRRVRECRAAALAMIARGVPPVLDPAPAPTVGSGTVPDSPAVREAVRTGVPGATAITGATWWGWVQAHPVTSVLIVVAIGAAVVFALHKLKQYREAKQVTPMPGTPVVPMLEGMRP